MSIKTIFAATMAVAFLATGPAFAQADKSKPRTAKSIQCSKEADAKGLKGKERRKFRSKCRRG